MVVEKHIKLDDAEETVDSFFSLTIEAFAVLVREVRKVKAALGTIDYTITPEASKNKGGRRSLYVSAPINTGEVFTEKNIKSVRPGYGLDTEYYNLVLGRRAACDLTIGDRLNWDVIA